MPKAEDGDTFAQPRTQTAIVFIGIRYSLSTHKNQAKPKDLHLADANHFVE